MQASQVAVRSLNVSDHRGIRAHLLAIVEVVDGRMRPQPRRLPETSASEVRRNARMALHRASPNARDANRWISLAPRLVLDRANDLLNSVRCIAERPSVDPHEQIESVSLAALVANPAALALVVRPPPAISAAAHRARAVLPRQIRLVDTEAREDSAPLPNGCLPQFA